MIRVLFSIIIYSIYLMILKVEKIEKYFTIIGIGEIICLLTFFAVMGLYKEPNFLIQLLGIITIIIAVFIIPNKFTNMLVISTFAAIGFITCSYLFIQTINKYDFVVSIFYIVIDILLCCVFAYNNEKHHHSEFLIKQELKRISSTDCLTNTANRSVLECDADEMINYCRNNKKPLCLIFFDVDDMKSINDTYGHLFGDTVLQNIALIIQKKIDDKDLFARWGGDEFALLLPEKSLGDAMTLIDEIKKDIADYDFVDEIKISCSFGLVEMNETSTFNDMLKEADKLMYSGKKLGKNNVCANNSVC